MLKKLLLIFWEVVPKTDSEGKLMQEMILVCDAYRKDLQHPNEFIRGATLRFLCKLKVQIWLLKLYSQISLQTISINVIAKTWLFLKKLKLKLKVEYYDCY